MGKLTTIICTRTTKIVACRVEDVELNGSTDVIDALPNVTRHNDSELACNDVRLRDTIDSTSDGIPVLGSSRAQQREEEGEDEEQSRHSTSVCHFEGDCEDL